MTDKANAHVQKISKEIGKEMTFNKHDFESVCTSVRDKLISEFSKEKK